MLTTELVSKAIIFLIFIIGIFVVLMFFFKHFPWSCQTYQIREIMSLEEILRRAPVLGMRTKKLKLAECVDWFGAPCEVKVEVRGIQIPIRYTFCINFTNGEAYCGNFEVGELEFKSEEKVWKGGASFILYLDREGRKFLIEVEDGESEDNSLCKKTLCYVEELSGRKYLKECEEEELPIAAP